VRRRKERARSGSEAIRVEGKHNERHGKSVKSDISRERRNEREESSQVEVNGNTNDGSWGAKTIWDVVGCSG